MTTQVMTTKATGNTKPVAFRGRAFQFTLNEVDKYDKLVDLLKDLKTCTYIISCKEKAPTTGHEHIHIYTHFSQPYKLSKKILSIGAHIEICRGSPKQNIDYIEKDGDIIEEYGERPRQGILNIKDLKECPIDDIPPTLYRIKKEVDEEERSKNTFFNMLKEIKEDNLKAPEIIYITGESGSGKTYRAYKTALEKYNIEDIGKLTINNNFIDITNENAKCFVIEEFRSSQIKAADFLQLIDKYGYRANIKGSFRTLRPETIIICSIIHPNDLYVNEEINEQFRRRITLLINLNASLKKTTDDIMAELESDCDDIL